MTQSQLEDVRRFAEEVASREGCILYDLEFREGPGRALRVFIDKEPDGVSLDDCVNVSRGLNLRLDVEDIIPGGGYELEVSSPGLERKLTQPWHFEKAVGQTIQLKYLDERGVEASYQGRIIALEESRLSLENSKGPFLVELSSVRKARVVLVDVFQKKPAPGKKKR